MAKYRYKAKSLDGKTVEAVQDAVDDVALEKFVSDQGLILITSSVESGRKKKSSFFTTTAPPVTALNATDLIFFTMELGTSYSAGLPLLQTLEDMAVSAETRGVRDISRGIAERVRGGQSLAQSLTAYPKAFPNLYVELVSAAEKTGKLKEVLEDLVRFLEWQKETRSQIVGASMYPIAMIGAVIGLTLVLTLFVFPRFLATFASMGGDLPVPTKILLWVDHTFGAYKVPIAAIVVLGPIAFVALQKVEKAKWYIDLAKLKAPLVGPLLTKIMMSLFSHNLAMMIGSGLDFSAALRLCERIMDNQVFAELVKDARAAVEQGKPLSEAMARDNLVPSLVRRMLKLGETTGAMEESLENVSKYYDKEIPRAIKRMFAVMEPLILVAMAGIVLFMASAVLLPIYGMINKMGAQQ